LRLERKRPRAAACPKTGAPGIKFSPNACGQIVFQIVTEKTLILPPSLNGHGPDASYRLTLMVPKRRYLSYLRERWWVVLTTLVLAIGAMVTYETIRPQNYSSFAQIYLSGDLQLNVGSVFSEEALTYFGTQIELLKSARLQGAALEAAGITVPPGEKNPYKVDIIQPMKTSILQLQATGPDPALTQRYLQTLIEKYLAYKKETRISTSQDLLDSLQDELNRKAGDLQAEQDKLAVFQKSNNVAVLAEEGRSAGVYLSDLNLELAKSELELRLLSQGQTNGSASLAALDFTNAIPSSTQPSSTNLVATSDDSAFNQVRLDLAILLGNKQDKIRSMGSYGFDQEVARLQRLISIMVAEKQTTLKERIAAIQLAIPNWETKMLTVNDRLSQGQRLMENVAREQGYYDHLLGTLENVDLGKNVQQEQLSILQPATPARPELRSFILRVVLAGIGGIFFGLALVFIWYMLDDRFVSVRDIKDQFGETILGLVPQIKAPAAQPKTALLADVDSRHAYMESYRHLRSALLLSSFGEGRPQTLLFTSASPGEGKTTIAVNLARLLARSRLRVVLVDADARGSGMNRLLGHEEKSGVLDYLRGNAMANAVVHSTEVDGLSVVPRGTHAEHSEGLFLRPKLLDLISELRQNHDFVILDGAPILTSDDAALLVPHADAIVLVTRPFYTQSRRVRQALDMLYQRQAKHVSIILNRARAEDMAGHYAVNGVAAPVHNGKT
jgi:succinoglycan biosynthesis transport protein ExoP